MTQRDRAGGRADGPVVAFCCDAGSVVGLGHLMRCLALAEELRSRGNEPVFVCDLSGLAWARAQVSRRGWRILTPPSTEQGYLDAVLGVRPAAVVVDSYRLAPGISRGLRGSGLPVLAVVDGTLGRHDADLYVDQNVGAEEDALELPAGARRLAGLRYAMVRDEVLAARATSIGIVRPEPVQPPRVLAFFGGTDPFGAAPALTAALAATGVPFAATVVASRPDLVREIGDVPLMSGQRLEVIAPTDRIAELASDADLVLAAAGTSMIELLCVGAAAALVRVADNQRVGYERIVRTGAVVGLGALDAVRANPAKQAEVLGPLLTDHDARARLRHAARQRVDGHGRQRVADALLAVTSSRGPE